MIQSNYRFYLFSTLLFLFVNTSLFGQGWRKTYDFYPSDFTTGLIKTQDGKLVMTGTKLVKVDLNGDILWQTDYAPSTNFGFNLAAQLADGSIVTGYGNASESTTGIHKFDANGNLLFFKELVISNASAAIQYTTDLAVTPEQDILITGWFPDISCLPWNMQSYALKMNPDGDVVWFKLLSVCGGPHTRISTVVALEEEAYVFGGHIDSSDSTAISLLTKTDTAGNVLWTKFWNLGNANSASGITALMETVDHHLIMSGKHKDSVFPFSTKIYVQKTDTEGNVLWTNFLDSFHEITYVNSIVENANGQFILTGTTQVTVPGAGSEVGKGFILAIDQFGNEIWRKIDNYGGAFQEFFNSIVLLDNGNFAILGVLANNTGTDMLLVFADSVGNIHSHVLNGKVFSDNQFDCQYDGNETSLSNWVVWANGEHPYYAFTDASGNYFMPIDTGEYEIVVTPHTYWEPCQASYPVQISTLYDSTQIDLPQQPTINCALLEVDISTPILRLCNQGYYAVSYCNNGTLPAGNATVEITLDDDLQYLSASAPLLSQSGQTFVFDLGDVGINACGTFQIMFMTGCDQSLFGQTLCTEAHIFPDSICNNTWTGANLEATAICVGDSVHFTINNTGGDMPDAFEYIVIEDNIILMTDEFQLPGNEELNFAAEAQSGATYFLVAAQDPDLPPIFGNSVATAIVENCVGPVNPGAFNQLPQDDGEPWLSTDCHEVVASYDPNDKTAFPGGWQDEHFIEARTELDYLIRFQNTGTDTAFKVVLIDTLSLFLDPATIRPGAGSHPYAFELSGQGVVKFIFNNILLPDSTTNEAASHGWVKFRIAQMPDNPVGSVIENTAGIYFDFNAPVYTNTTFHTIGEPWVQVISHSVEAFHPNLEILVFPNPMGDFAWFDVKNLPKGENKLKLYDLTGKTVLQQNFTAGKITIQRNGLSAGLYFFRIKNNGKTLATGKIAVK